jgi:hypothetical protein
MKKMEDEYRRKAAEAFDLVRKASFTTDKGRLLVLAEAWLELADCVSRTRNQQQGRAAAPYVPAPPTIASRDLG